MPSSQQYWSAEAGSGGAFENLVLSVVGMRGDIWVVSALFGMVCNGFRRAFARDSRTLTLPLQTIPNSPETIQGSPRMSTTLRTEFWKIPPDPALALPALVCVRDLPLVGVLMLIGHCVTQ